MLENKRVIMVFVNLLLQFLSYCIFRQRPTVLQSPTYHPGNVTCHCMRQGPMLAAQHLNIKPYNCFLTVVWKECLHCRDVRSFSMDSIQIIQSSSEVSFDFDQLDAKSFTPPQAVPPNLSRPIVPA
jgi:hypothetical protein